MSEIKIMNGAVEVLVLPRHALSISETRARETMIVPIQYTNAVMGMDLVATEITLNIAGEIYIAPASDYATILAIITAFRATMPATSLQLTLTDDDGVYSLTNILIEQFKVDATKATPNGLKYTMQLKGITTFLG